MTEPAAASEPSAAHAASAEPLLRTLQGLWRELPGLLSDRVELLSLELERAGGALLQILALVVAAAILGVTAWLVLWVCIVAGLQAAGLPLWLALLVALLCNVLAAALALSRLRTLLPQVGLPATRRHLTFSPAFALPVTPPSDGEMARP